MKITRTGGTSNGQRIRQAGLRTTQQKNDWAPAPIDDIVNLSGAALSAASTNAIEEISPANSRTAGSMPDPRETGLAILEAEIGMLLDTDRADTPTDSSKKVSG